MRKSKNLGGRGNKSPVPKKSYRLASDIGDIAKKISEQYESLSEIDKNKASELLDGLEGLIDDVSKKLS